VFNHPRHSFSLQRGSCSVLPNLLPFLSRCIHTQYDEYFWSGIYAAPHSETMLMLEQAKNLQDVLDNIPDMITEKPDIAEENNDNDK